MDPSRAQDLTPRAIVEELDRYIVGQKAAKRAVAVALRNRWRRQQVPPPMRDEIAPKNIMLIGPTGVGKTEIARRLAQAGGARRSSRSRRRSSPRSATSGATSIRWCAIWPRPRCRCCARKSASACAPRARENAEERLLDVLLPPAPRQRPAGPANMTSSHGAGRAAAGRPEPPTDNATRENLRRLLREGKLDDKMVEIDTADAPPSFIDVFSGTGMEEMVLNLRDMFPQGARRTKRRRLSVPEAMDVLTDEEATKLIDLERLQKDAIRRAEQAGIIFIDEIDKVAGRESAVATARTSHARACSATCCRSSRARRCRRSTGRSRPTTCCSSPPARSTSRSPRT